MKRLIHIQASPMEDLSFSNAVASAFVETFKQTHPRERVKTLDIFKMRLPPFDGYAVRAKYAIMHGLAHSEEQKEAWAQVVRIVDQFKKADKYLFSVPMWNFSIPYRLKHYLDLLLQPGLTFSFSPQEGYKGLVAGKPAVVVYARGGEYAPGTPTEAFDLQKKYFELALGFIGFKDIKSIVVESTLSGAEISGRKKEAAIAEARQLAEKF